MELKTSIPLLVVGLEMRLLSTPATAVRRESSGRGGATDPHGHAVCSGVNSSRPIWEGRGELNSPAGAVLTQDGEASELDPEVLHCRIVRASVLTVYWVDRIVLQKRI